MLFKSITYVLIMHYYAFHASIFRVVALLFSKPESTESTFISGICCKLRGWGVGGVPPVLTQIHISLYTSTAVCGEL